uniref:(+)-delta-cadinene synthase isozyme XC1 n=1 Tax=Cajanus cajan TaxID=3821 RepID=A0A151T3I5_CAJCA|nr:(+)-delta-cadinene synthase isozyme XC1 [Cajanus cajan]
MIILIHIYIFLIEYFSLRDSVYWLFYLQIFTFTKGYMVEARWCLEGYIPTYNEYKVNEILTTGIPVLLTTFIGAGKFTTKDVFDWIFSDSKIIEVASVIGRFLDVFVQFLLDI